MTLVFGGGGDPPNDKIKRRWFRPVFRRARRPGAVWAYDRTVKCILAIAAVRNVIPVVAVLAPLSAERYGMDFQQVLMSEAVFAATVLALEVPSGWLSDVWKRRSTLVAGKLFAVAGFGVLCVADDFAGACLAQALIGVGCALTSGTDTALMHDALKADGREKSFRKFLGLKQAFCLYSVGITGALGGVLWAWYGAQGPLYATFAAGLVAMAATFLLKEPPREKQAMQGNPLKDMVISVRDALRGAPLIGGVIGFGAALFAATKTGFWLQQPWYESLGIDPAWFGTLLGASFLIGGLGGQFSERLEKRFGRRGTLGLLAGVAVGAMAVTAASPVVGAPWAGVPALAAMTAVFGFAMPVLQDVVNAHLPPARRATVLSAMQLAISLSFIPVSLVVGGVVDGWGVAAGAALLAGIAAAGTMPALKLMNRQERGQQKWEPVLRPGNATNKKDHKQNGPR